MMDEIRTCMQIRVHLKLRDESPFFVRLYIIQEVVKREMDLWDEKGLTGHSSPHLLVKGKQHNLFCVCTGFRVLNDRLVWINHALSLILDYLLLILRMHTTPIH